MIHFFELPQIQDNVRFATSMKGGFASSDDAEMITKADQLRSFVKDALENGLNNMQRLPIYTYEPKMEEYLKMQTQIGEFFAQNASHGLKFLYSPFISTEFQLAASSPNNETEMATEIIMTRFGYSILLSCECFYPLNDFYDKIGFTFEGGNAEKWELVNEHIHMCIQKAEKPVLKMMKLIASMKYLAPSLNPPPFSECDPAFTVAAANIFIIGFASLHLETLRNERKFEKLAMVAKGMWNKVNESMNVIFSRRNSMKPEILDWLSTAIVFFEAYMIFALMKNHEFMISIDDFSKGNFPVLVREFRLMFAKMKQLEGVFLNLNVNKESQQYKYASNFFMRLFLPYANFKLATFANLNIDEKLKSKSVEEIVSGLQKKANYFEEKFK